MKEDQVTQFGRYELTERLAIGGMAELFRAVMTGSSGFRKTVAIKVILPKLGQHDKFREMFHQEGRLMAALHHRNLVQIYDIGEINDELFMCIEFMLLIVDMDHIVFSLLFDKNAVFCCL